MARHRLTQLSLASCTRWSIPRDPPLFTPPISSTFLRPCYASTNITNRRWTRAMNCLPSIELYTQLDARCGQLYGY